MGLTNYWGYNTLGFFCPARVWQPTLATPGARVPQHGARPACRRHRGAAGRRLQPHGRRRRARPHAQLARAGQRRWYRLPPDQRAAYDNYSGCGNTLDMRQPAVLQPGAGQPALLGAGDACRRLPLRPGHRCWAAATAASSATGPFFKAMRPRPGAGPLLAAGKLIAEPWDIGPRRLPGGQLPARLAGMERQLPRHGARLLAGRRLTRGEVCAALAARPTCSRRARAGRRNRSTTSSRTTASRCATWSATTCATTSQRRAQPRRPWPQPELELRHRRPDRRPRLVLRLRQRCSAPCWPRCC
jgi:hypothetical protein